MKKFLPLLALALLLGHRAGSGIVQMQARPVPQVWLKSGTNTVTLFALATETGLRLTTENQTYEITR